MAVSRMQSTSLATPNIPILAFAPSSFSSPRIQWRISFFSISHCESCHRWKDLKTFCDHDSFQLLRNGGGAVASENVGTTGVMGRSLRRMQCRAMDQDGGGGLSRNGAIATSRHPSSRSPAEQDQQFVAELRKVMDAKGLPKLTVPSPKQLSDRPDLAKGLRSRGQFHIARLLGSFAASEQASPFPPSAASSSSTPPANTSGPPFQESPQPSSSATTESTPNTQETINGSSDTAGTSESGRQPFGFQQGAPAGAESTPPREPRPLGPPPIMGLSNFFIPGASATSDSAITNQKGMIPDSPPIIPIEIFGQLEANAQGPGPSQVQQRGGNRGPNARGTGKPARPLKPLPPRDPQATTEAVERLRQLGQDVLGSEAPMTSSGPRVMPPARPETQPAKSVTSTEPSLAGPSVAERAARFLQTGKLDESIESEDAESGTRADVMSADSIAAQKAALLKAKLRQRNAVLPTPPVFDVLQSQNEKVYKEMLTEQQQLQQMSLSEGQVDDDFKAQTFEELNKIKEALASRESEVAIMGEALKEARAQLNLLRAKSAAELSQARQEVLELQTRLRFAEKALEGLKQVRVEYWGQGEVVQLAGSFNNWGHYLTMEPDLSTEIPPPEGGRGPMVFGCDLRLYPGDYEVKFIVDGDWQVDNRREIVYRGMNQNNLLRVE